MCLFAHAVITCLQIDCFVPNRRRLELVYSSSVSAAIRLGNLSDTWEQLLRRAGIRTFYAGRICEKSMFWRLGQQLEHCSNGSCFLLEGASKPSERQHVWNVRSDMSRLDVRVCWAWIPNSSLSSQAGIQDLRIHTQAMVSVFLGRCVGDSISWSYVGEREVSCAPARARCPLKCRRRVC